MGIVDLHLGPLKSQTGRKAALHGPKRTGDQPQHPVPEKKEEEKKKNPSSGPV